MDEPIDIPMEHSGELAPMHQIDIVIADQRPLPLQETLTTSEVFKPTPKKRATAKTIATATPPLLRTTDDRYFQFTLGNPAAYSGDSDDEDDARTNYQHLLLESMESTAVIQRFNLESCSLVESGAKAMDFSISACYHRLASGHDVQVVNIDTLQLEDYRVYATPEGIEWKQRSTSKSFVKYTDMAGLVVGTHASAFRLLKVNGFDFKGYNLEDSDCMTLITDITSYAFATDNDIIRYDLYLLLAWQITSKSQKTSMVPLTKQQLSVMSVRMKIFSMAKAKHMFPEELWLLAIVKTLCQQPATPDNQERIQKVKAILDTKFKLPQKLYRIISRLMPENYTLDKAAIERMEDRQRIIKLQQRMASNFSKKTFQNQNLLLDWDSIKNNASVVSLSLHKAMKQQQTNSSPAARASTNWKSLLAESLTLTRS